MDYLDISSSHVTNVHDSSTELFRLLNKEKLEYLINNKRLYLRSLNLFDRKEEPSYTDNDIDGFTRFRIQKHIQYQGVAPSAERIEKAKNLTKYMYDSTRDEFFICCFTKGPITTRAWEEYTISNKLKSSFGCAIRTTVGSLKKSIKSNDQFGYLSNVVYSERQSGQSSNVALPYFYKPIAFGWEKEYRLMIWGKDREFKGDKNIDLAIELNEFIHEIIPSPFNTAEENAWLKSLCELHGLIYKG